MAKYARLTKELHGLLQAIPHDDPEYRLTVEHITWTTDVRRLQVRLENVQTDAQLPMTHTTRFPDAATAKAWSHYVNWWAKYGEGWSEIRARLDSDDEESDEEPSDSGVTTNERTLDVDPPKKGGKVGVEARYPDLYSDLIYEEKCARCKNARGGPAVCRGTLGLACNRCKRGGTKCEYSFGGRPGVKKIDAASALDDEPAPPTIAPRSLTKAKRLGGHSTSALAPLGPRLSDFLLSLQQAETELEREYNQLKLLVERVGKRLLEWKAYADQLRKIVKARP